jgi:hypothetical protein
MATKNKFFKFIYLIHIFYGGGGKGAFKLIIELITLKQLYIYIYHYSISLFSVWIMIYLYMIHFKIYYL